MIVTNDSRAGFPTAPALVRENIGTVTPAQFATDIVSAHPAACIRALNAMSARMATPPHSPAEILDELARRYNMVETAAVLRSLLDR